MAKKKTWQEFEELVHKIYKELEPHADVKANDFILGRFSKTQRQIDISLRSKIGAHEILTVIDAKDHKRSADVNVVGQFEALMKDVGANLGVLICNTGFTKAAKEMAKSTGIQVCSAHDASKLDWQTIIKIPVLKRSLTVNLMLRFAYVVTGQIDHSRMTLPDIMPAINLFLQKWEKGELPKHDGEHILQLDREALLVKNQPLFALGSAVHYKVSSKYHFKSFVPVDYRGIKDYISEKFTPSFMEFNEKIPIGNDDGTWQFVPDPSKIAGEPIRLEFEVVTIDMFKINMIKAVWKET